MEDRFTYGLNPEKLGAVSSYLCDPNTAPAEFLLVKSQYLAETGRAVSRGALFFQIRQAFLPGEVTAEEANRIGYETAMRWTKGKYQLSPQYLRTDCITSKQRRIRPLISPPYSSVLLLYNGVKNPPNKPCA